MGDKFRRHTGSGGKSGRPAMLSVGLGSGARGGLVIPTDSGDGMDDGTKYRDLVWVPDGEKVWRAAKKVAGKECSSPSRKRSPTASAGDTVWVHTPRQNTSVEVPKDQTHAYDPSHALDLDDASKMNQMHEAPLLDLLLRRFRKDAIYTNVADVLISVNPYKNIPLLYEVPLQQMQDELEDEFEESDGDGEGEVEGRGRNGRAKDARPKALSDKLAKPHVFSVADRAFRYMKSPGAQYTHGKRRGMNQSIIISGESGAGKTEASKHVMRYLITASQLATGVSQDKVGDESSDGVEAMAKRIEATLLRSNTLLEAFGNAKTLRNDNSSRFGKYIKLLYDSDSRLMGASTDHFLLEKSRLVKVDSGERGYHIFYQMLAGLDEATAEALSLAPAEEFHMISQGDCVAISDEVDDRQARHVDTEFLQTEDAMKTLGFEADDKAAVFRVLAALLHLGNVHFEETESPAQGAAKAKICRTGSSLSSSNGSSSGDGAGLAKAAGLLGLDEDTLARKVMWRAIMTPGKSLHEIALTARESSDNLSALSKHTYGKLFTWVVAFVNRCHQQHVRGVTLDKGAAGLSGEIDDDEDNRSSFIGILDIFGFEIMATNSFEQLCINFANEVLQRQFNHHIFVLEQASGIRYTLRGIEEYKAEGLDVAAIPFKNNQAIIDLICKKPLGLMIILEDQVLTGRKAHAMNKLNDRSVLDLYHQDDLRALLLDSEDGFIRELAEITPTVPDGQQQHTPQNSPARVGVAFRGAASPPSPPPRGGVGGRFESERQGGRSPVSDRRLSRRESERQLDSLVMQLGQTEPHYIKCIKPNSAKAPGGWSSPLVIDQLRYSGVLEVVRIRREAYPLRLDCLEMYHRFRFLAEWKVGGNPPPEKCSEEQARVMCGEICSFALEADDFQLGKTRVFLKDNALDKLRWALQAKYVSAACGIQAAARSFLARNRLRNALRERAELRAREAARQAEETRQRRAAAQVQIAKAARGLIQRKRLERETAASTVVQACWRGYNARKTLESSRAARRTLEGRRATELQAWARMLLAGQARTRARRASTTLASAWRMRSAVVYKKQAVADVTALQARERGREAGWSKGRRERRG
ncbi:unnamed protein product [Ectocarpus fasciculatus]